MDTRLLEYVIKIEEERSITKAAEKLFVTQSALNQQLQKLERELETPLFIRTRSDWRPTPAGEVYIQAAKDILNKKKDAYSRILDIRRAENRRIAIGLTPERGVDMFSCVYPEFHKNYPDVQMDPIECNVSSMQQLICHGELNLGLVTLTEQQKDDNTYLHMTDEELFLAIPASHPLAAQGSPIPETAPEISLSQFCESPFILIFRRSTLYRLVENLFQEAGFQPRVLFTTGSIISQYRMVLANVGCAILPHLYARPDSRITFFRIQGRPCWEVAVCCRNGAYLSCAEEEFIRLCRKYHENLPLTGGIQAY